uniref:Uncharacterized protein n=1 Tax=Anguilla anguilla TaxID=7936 RepID=A0A0E9WB40_ANGAN
MGKNIITLEGLDNKRKPFAGHIARLLIFNS